MTADVTLEADLLDCPGDGLVVTAPDVTIDLDSHRVDGSGAATGIDVQAPGVTVRDGRISGFQNGVRLPDGGVGEALLADLNVGSSDRGVALLGDVPWGSGNDGSVRIRDSHVHHNRIGVAASFWLHQTCVGDGTIKANASGISFRDSRGATVSANRIAANDGPGLTFDFTGAARGGQRHRPQRRLELTANRSSGLVLAGNSVTRNGPAAPTSHGRPGDDRGQHVQSQRRSGLSLSEFLETRSLWPIHRNVANRNTSSASSQRRRASSAPATSPSTTASRRSASTSRARGPPGRKR